MSEFLSLDKISSYNKSFELSNYTYDLITKWEWLAKQTIGIQFIRAWTQFQQI